MSEESKVEQARSEDFLEIKQLLDKANSYSVQRSGLPLWTAMDYVYDDLKTQINDGDCFMTRNEQGEITATITLNDNADFWDRYDNNDQAAYFHKFMKDPQKASSEDTKTLLGFVAEETMRRNKSLLRCDTVPDLEGLIRHYEKLGFARKGTFIYPSSGRNGILLEVEPSMLLGRLALTD